MWWAAYLCSYTPPPLCYSFPSQLIKHCCSFTGTFWASILFCFLFALVLERLFWVRRNLVFKAMTNGRRGWGVLEWEIWCIFVCVHNYATLLHFSDQMPTKASLEIWSGKTSALFRAWCLDWDTVLHFIHVWWTEFSLSTRSVAAGSRPVA